MRTNLVQTTTVVKTSFNLSSKTLRTLLLVLLPILAVCNAWGTGSQTFHATSAEPAKGLVYANNSSTANPATSVYTTPSAAAKVGSDGSEGMAFASYAWAMPARGYKFSQWTASTNGNTAPSGETYNPVKPATNTGTADKFTTTVPRMQTHHGWTMASFGANTNAYDVVYKEPVGGSYSVKYEYLIVNESTKKFTESSQTLSLTSTSGDKMPTDPRDEANHKTYDNDVITLSSSSPNFIAWYKDGVQMSTANPYSSYKADANANISALFKRIELVSVSGDLALNVTGTGTYGGKNVYVSYSNMTGTWTVSNFTISPKNTSNDYGSIVIGDISIDTENNRLVIPYTYTASAIGDISMDVTLTPQYGETINFAITASASESFDYEARIEIGGEIQETGTLAEMMTRANGNTYTNPTVKLVNPVTITSPLSFQKSMTFDAYGKVLTANCASAFSIDAADIDVKIIDSSFTQNGNIHTSTSSTGVVSVATFAQKAKLTMQGGTLSVTNTGSGAAYGIDVQQGSIFYMTNGNLTVSANTGNAQGVHVATAADYATLNGGIITVSAPTNAYGIWSAGQCNITNATIDVDATTTTNAYGAYVNGGVTTMTTTSITSTAKTTGAYGGYVNAGRLNINGGVLDVAAETSGVYGVQIQAGATANIQQNTTITAAAIGASGTNVFGINNLGTVSLTNITVNATSPTNYATAVNSQTSATATTIEGGTYTATTETGYAYGLHHQYGTLNVDGGTFKGVINTSGANAYGARAAVNATIANATMLGEAKGSANTAYGFVGGVAGKTITLTNCDITGKSNTSKAYAIYSRTGVTATGCTLTASTSGTNYAYGFYAENGNNSLVNTDAVVTSNTTYAYGVYHAAGTLTINGGEYNVDTKQATATAAASSYSYGLYNAASTTTTIDGTNFNVTASNNTFSQDIYGAYVCGTLNSTGGAYSAQGKLNVYGIWGHTASTLNLKNNTISSTVTNGTVSYGIYAKKNFTIDGDIVSAVGSSTKVYAMFFDATNSVGDVLGGKFSAQGNGTNDYGALNASGTIGKVRLKGGVYKSTINLPKYTYTGYQIYHLDGTHPDYAAGYRYIIATANPSNYVCRIVGGSYYTTLEEALQYTIDNSGSNYTIVMTQHYTVPAGNYRLPSNATLLVPYKFEQTSIAGETPIKVNTVGLRENFLCLTFADGAYLNVDGKIEAGGEMYCQESGQICYNNSPYGQIHMTAGSRIQLNSGARLYAWGYISGTGDIIAKNGAKVYEMFQIGDMPTVGNLYDHYNNNSHKFFPFNRYFIQNNEAPTTYYYGSELITAMYIYYKGSNAYHGDNSIKLVGTSGALFLVTGSDESSWVRKSYDATKDYQVWEVNSSAALGSISLTLSNIPVFGSISVNSTSYYLPITYNMKIHIKSGTFAITQTSELLPGASIEIDKTATLQINSSQNLYVFDKDQWPWTSQYSAVFSPGWTNGSKPSRTVGDAAINVHGNIDVKGKLYTSNKGTETTKTDGANIYSTNEDAGTVHFSTAAGTSTATVTLMTSATATKAVTMELAQLKNGVADPEYTSTSGAAVDDSYIYIDNRWVRSYQNGCFYVIEPTVYAKPSEYVALKKTQTVSTKLTGVEETNHTYLTADDKLLILMDDCQWWEVEATSDPTVFECKKEGYEGFYYYDTSSSKWKLKTVTVTFYSQETGNTVLKTITTDWQGVPDQAVIATTPTKATTAAATYTFYGWKSSVTGTEYHWTATLEKASSDMSYRPVFTANPRHYTITLNNAYNGETVKLEVAYGATPEYTPVKERTAQYTYSFTGWNTPFVAVTGTATYTAQWSSTVNRYDIVWKNGDETLETDANQAYGAATAYNGATPTKATDDDYVYTFSKWKSSLNGNLYNNGSTPTVAGATTYEAQFSTTPRYRVIFKNYDGSTLASDCYTQGTIPSYSGTPTRPRDYDGYFVFTGWKNSAGTEYAADATLPAVTAKETYTAQYSYTLDMFLITLNNVNNGASWSGKFGLGSMPFYNPNGDDVPVTPIKAGDAYHTYTFSGWTPTMVPVTGAATYTAVFDEEVAKYTITWLNEDNSQIDQTEVEYGVVPTHADPSKAATAQYTYTFTGWTPTPTAVTEPATYKATFSQTTRTYTITWLNDDNSLINTTEVAYGVVPTHADPTKAATAEWTYTFAGWNTTPVAVTGDATYKATFNKTKNSYTITWLMDDDSQINTTTVEYGVIPTHADAVKANTAEWSYTFTGWTPTIVAVTGAATYKATFSQTKNQYNITFNNLDGNGSSQTIPVDYGTSAATLGTLVSPEKATDCSNWAFTGWSPALATVTGTATYTATFSSEATTRQYAITFDFANGTAPQVVQENCGESAYWNDATPTKAEDAQYTYTFHHWEPALTTVTGPTTYTAQYSSTIRKYNIVWKSEDGMTSLETDADIAYGTTTAFNGTTPTKAATAQYTYTFDGWSTEANGGGTFYADGSTPAVGGPATYYAHFSASVNNYTISASVNPVGYGAVSSSVSVPYGSTFTTNGNTISVGGQTITATPAAVETLYTYAFDSWSSIPASVTGNATVTANFTRSDRLYEVTFNMQGHGTAPAKQDIKYNGKVTEPADPAAPAGYTFEGWYKEPACENAWNFSTDVVTANTTIYAKWHASTFTVTWNANGGSCATATTTKNPDEAIGTLPVASRDGYEFVGWYTEASAGSQITESTIVTAPVTYYAHYIEIGNTTVAIAYTSAGALINRYTSWADAITGAKSNPGCTLKFYQNVTSASAQTINVNMTIDLNGCTISGTGGSSNSQLLSVSSALTIKDSKTTGGISYSGSSRYTYTTISVSGNGASVTLNGGTISATNSRTTNSNNGNTSARVVSVATNATLTINGGELVATSRYGTAYAVYNNNTNVTITGGKVKAIQNNSTTSGSAYVFSTANRVTASAETSTSYFSKDPTNDITVKTGYEKTTTTTGDPSGYAYKVIPRNYNVTFENLNGSGASSCTTISVPFGTTPECPVIPEKVGSNPAEYYEWTGWQNGANHYSTTDPLPNSVPSDVTYTATFSETPSARKIYITFDPANGDEPRVVQVDYNTMPAWEGADPTKASTAEFEYAFTGWDPTLAPATEATTYTAQYSSTRRSYTITFEDYDGTELQSSTLEYGTTPTPPSNPSREGYLFTGWSPAVTSVTGAVTYTAQYAAIVATVTTTANVTTPYSTWDAALTAARGAASCTLKLYKNVTAAISTPIDQNMTIDLNGCIISGSSSSTTSGQNRLLAVTKPLIIVDSQGGGKISFTGTGGTNYNAIAVLDNSASLTVYGGTIESNATTNSNSCRAIAVIANYGSVIIHGGELIASNAYASAQSYVVYNYNSRPVTVSGGKLKVLTNGSITASNAAIFYDASSVTATGGYYSKDPGSMSVPNTHQKQQITNATMDPEYNNNYRYRVVKKSCTITWMNEDGTGDPLQTNANVDGGSTVLCPADPTKTTPVGYSYTFDGWATEANGEKVLDKCSSIIATEDITYYAHFTSTPIEYTISYDLADGIVATPNPETYTIETATFTLNNPTKAGSTFTGWTGSNGESPETSVTIAAGSTGNKSYTANWALDDVGFYVDIVDVDNSEKTLKINVSGTEWPTAGWPYSIKVGDAEAVSYGQKSTSGLPNYRADDRTITVEYAGNAGDAITITVKNTGGTTISMHSYAIPAEITSATTLAADQAMPLFVKGATLTINGNISARNIYIGSDAKLVINSDKTLAVDTLFLRTTPESAAELVNNGAITGRVYYTRIISDKSGYKPFGLPLSCAISAVKLSNGNSVGYKTSSGWILRYYDEEKRATTGPNDNWVTLSNTGEDKNKTIQAGKGYEMYSGVNYYREFYFPVDLSTLTNSVSVAYTAGDQAVNSGWNVLVSPLTQTLTLTPKPEDMTVNWMQPDGTFEQENPSSIPPAKTFAYQATKAGSIVFAGTSMTIPSIAPRRVTAMEEPTQIQWIHLDVEDANGVGDQTSIYSHPTRYDEVYQTGIDVAKQSLTASRAIIYSSHVYGDMAFAGVADSLLESGVALTVYSPSEQELTISMRDNEWLNRMENVWLVDRETGLRVDLLWSDYAFRVPEGTTTGRLFIQGVFRAPQITTDIEPTSDSSLKGRDVRKVIINDKIYIIVNGRMFDSTGKLVLDK